MTDAQNRKRWSVDQRKKAREAMAIQIEAERLERDASFRRLAELQALLAEMGRQATSSQ